MLGKIDWKGGFKVSAIVGSILTIINQYQGLFGNHPIDWLALGLTYLVPFIVFNWGKLKAAQNL